MAVFVSVVLAMAKIRADTSKMRGFFASLRMTSNGNSNSNSRFLRCATEWKCKKKRNGNAKRSGMGTQEMMVGQTATQIPFGNG